ncbi:MAG: hypothetical protein IPK82_25330 [Polyangiaceae bacterium]|nr:hypothetical protein [Polyangiaceae bacterium]
MEGRRTRHAPWIAFSLAGVILFVVFFVYIDRLGYGAEADEWAVYLKRLPWRLHLLPATNWAAIASLSGIVAAGCALGWALGQKGWRLAVACLVALSVHIAIVVACVSWVEGTLVSGVLYDSPYKPRLVLNAFDEVEVFAIKPATWLWLVGWFLSVGIFRRRRALPGGGLLAVLTLSFLLILTGETLLLVWSEMAMFWRRTVPDRYPRELWVHSNVHAVTVLGVQVLLGFSMFGAALAAIHHVRSRSESTLAPGARGVAVLLLVLGLAAFGLTRSKARDSSTVYPETPDNQWLYDFQPTIMKNQLGELPTIRSCEPLIDGPWFHVTEQGLSADGVSAPTIADAEKLIVNKKELYWALLRRPYPTAMVVAAAATKLSDMKPYLTLLAGHFGGRLFVLTADPQPKIQTETLGELTLKSRCCVHSICISKGLKEPPGNPDETWGEVIESGRWQSEVCP